MGWPLRPEYASSSNIGHAPKLEGGILLIVGKIDDDVDPGLTFRSFDQSIRDGKNFDLLVIPGAGRASGSTYGNHKRYDYFVRRPLGVRPADGRDLEAETKTTPTASAGADPCAGGLTVLTAVVCGLGRTFSRSI